MSERKVLNMYIDPDMGDPTKVPKVKKKKGALEDVRTMVPFSVQCNTCMEYIYKGKKFNAKKEVVKGETYMGIKIIRIYFKCTNCSAPITFKTDPANAGYTCETGAKQNYEMWRENEKEEEEEKMEKEKELENTDAMQALENKTMNLRTEQENLDAIEELKHANKRHEKVDVDGIIAKLRADDVAAANEEKKVDANLLDSGLTAEEEELVKSMKFGKASSHVVHEAAQEENVVDATASVASRLPANDHKLADTSMTSSSSKGFSLTAKAPVVVMRKRKVEEVSKEQSGPVKSTNNALSALAAYSDSDSD